jgi:hypothetical protein
LSHIQDGIDIIEQHTPIQFLPPEYELGTSIIIQMDEFIDPGLPAKSRIFGKGWGDGYIVPKQYTDTYFSVITETEFGNPYSFRTEKIWKPIIAGHPWICATNAGFYHDLINLGFLTFRDIFDESFDNIDDNFLRIQRVGEVVKEIVSQDLDKFLVACRGICDYNRKRAFELHQTNQKNIGDTVLGFIKKSYS